MQRILGRLWRSGANYLRFTAYFLLDDWQNLLAGRHLWVLLGSILLAIALCLTVRITGPGMVRVEDELEAAVEKGELVILWGLVRTEMFRGPEEAVQLVHCWLIRWGLGPVGILLCLACTAGAIPAFLQSGSSILVFTSPVSRYSIALYKHLAIVLFMSVLAAGFSLGTAVGLALATGYWPGSGLAAVGVFAIALAAFLGFSLLLGAVMRSQAAALVGNVLFWLVCYAINVSHWRAMAQHLAHVSSPAIASLPYWCLPKPADLLVLLDNLSGGSGHFASLPEVLGIATGAEFNPWWSISTSLPFGLVTTLLAGWELQSTEPDILS